MSMDKKKILMDENLSPLVVDELLMHALTCPNGMT
jgi:hypothetical protein